MIKRPSSKDSENDILQMQQDFYAEANRDRAFQPAAKVVRMKEPEGAEKAAPVRQSEFARRRKLQKEAAAAVKKEEVPEHTIIGEIVEKRYDGGEVPMEVGGEGVEAPFPKVVHVKTLPVGGGKGKKSLFAQMFGQGGSGGEDSKKVKFQLPSQSVILEGEESKEIHEENLQKIGQMSEEDILKEREHLLGTMDPKLVEFLKARKKGKLPDEKPKPTPIPEVEELKSELPDMEVLQQEGSDQWINFDILEPEKLQWTKDIQKTVKNLKPGETFEARFDWKGTLQPYVNPQESSEKDDRELYLHGEDADRPGYTLQELFRLARANVLQQRISALNVIAGILNIFNQGFYDGVLELPISKIFFFLRFALDENTPAVVEAASRALANLFYNDTDETLLDALYDTERGLYQPELGLNVTHSRSKEEEEEQKERRQRELERGFDAMKLSSFSQKKSQKPAQAHFSAHVDDDPDDLTNRETMNDYHLAETDLLECLARTNILERIRYVLFSMRPEGTTVVSCVKLLIRLARTNAEIAAKIAANEQLVGGLVRVYLGKGFEEVQGKHEPQHVVVKLLRVLCAYGGRIYERHLERYHVVSLLKRYVFTRRDINVKLIQVQIETFRFLRLILKLNRNDSLYCELLPALCYLLEWHFQHLAPDGSGPFIIRQHGAALLALIGYDHLSDVKDLATVLTPQALDRLFACFSKWFNGATKYGVDEFSQKLLLGACLGVATKMRHLAGSYYRSFVEGYLLVFLRSAKFEELMKQLRFSPLASPASHSGTIDRSAKIGPLPNLGAILTSDAASATNQSTPPPSLVLTKSYPIFLLHPLLGLLRHHVDHDPNPLDHFTRHPCQLNYLAKLTAPVTAPSDAGSGLGSKWFLKAELYYILDVLSVCVEHRRRRLHGKSANENDNSSPDGTRLLLALAFRVVLHLSDEFYPALGKLFDEVLFVRDFYRQSEVEVTAEEMQRWKFSYKMFVDRIRRSKELKPPARNTFTVGSAWRTPLLPVTWPYSPLYLLLEQLEQGLPKPGENHVAEEVLIPLTLKFSELAEANSVRFVTATQKLMYLMVAFLGPDSRFLEADLSGLITRRIDELRREMASGTVKFDFDTRLEERKSFHGLYQLLLDVFQSSSYGHAPFSALVMVPLAQQYDIQWRNLVWSEHVAVLRFITCSEQQLFGTLTEYLEPTETDVTLIKFYSQALHSNLLRPGSIPARIASHHVQTYRRVNAIEGRSGEGEKEANVK